MKSEHKAILASLLVVALCLSAVGGVTYSWFSDEVNNEITINTATFDLKFESNDPPTVIPAIGTTATVVPDDDALSISINNIAAATTVSIPYDMLYISTIDVIYRAYVDVSSIDTTAYEGKLKINGVSVTDAETVDDKKLIYIADWSPASKVADWTEVLGDQILSISTSDDFDVGDITVMKTFNLTLTAEMYQGNYTYDTRNHTVSSGEIVLTSGDVSGTTDSTKLTAKVDDAGESTPVTLEFDGKAIRNGDLDVGTTISIIQENGSESGTWVVEGNDTVSTITIKVMKGTEEVSDFGTGSISVTVTVPYTEHPQVFYVAGEDSYTPITITDITQNSTTSTTVTFITNHFSEYQVVTAADMEARDTMTGKYYRTLADAINAANTDEVEGNMIVLLKDITYNDESDTGTGAGRTLYTLTAPMSIDLNGYTIKSTYRHVFAMSETCVIMNGTIDQTGAKTSGGYDDNVSSVIRIKTTAPNTESNVEYEVDLSSFDEETDVTEVEGAVIGLMNINIIDSQANGRTRGIDVVESSYPVYLMLKDTSVNSTYYAIYVQKNNTAPVSLITSGGTLAAGWCAMYLKAPIMAGWFTETTFKGINDKSVSSSNGFGVIVLEKYGEGDEKFLFDKCTIEAKIISNAQHQHNDQYLILSQLWSNAYEGVEMYFNDCTFKKTIDDVTEIKTLNEVFHVEQLSDSDGADYLGNGFVCMYKSGNNHAGNDYGYLITVYNGDIGSEDIVYEPPVQNQDTL